MGKPIHEPYDLEFRARAVELVRSTGQSKAQVARDLGVNPETLRLWVKQAEIDAGRRDGLTTDEKSELARLRREVATLKEEREILKKAAAFFARESTTR
jgi:transposase